MLDERKAAILRVVVEEYIETAQPVGSAHVARSGVTAVSPATVRNEMAVLEHDGYLVQPHTSAGRVPTDKGYRFFVDQLTEPGSLPTAQRHLVRDFFAVAHGDRDQVFVGGASRMASAFDAVDTVRQVLAILEQQYVVVSLVREVLEQGAETPVVSIGAELGVQPLAECSIVLAPYAVEGEQAGTVGVL